MPLLFLVEEAGGTLGDLVKITTFIREWSDYAGFNEVRLDVLAGLGFASSTVQAALYAKDALVEIEAIAAISSTDTNKSA